MSESYSRFSHARRDGTYKGPCLRLTCTCRIRRLGMHALLVLAGPVEIFRGALNMRLAVSLPVKQPRRPLLIGTAVRNVNLFLG
jgi:hypothetical protein